MNLWPFRRSPKPAPPPSEMEQVYNRIARAEMRIIQGLKLMAVSNADKLAHVSAQIDALAAILDTKTTTTDSDAAAIDQLTAKVDAIVAAHTPAPVVAPAPVDPNAAPAA